MKSNFKKSEIEEKIDDVEHTDSDSTNLSKKEFEEFILNSGAKGSFMIFRSDNKDEELGLDEL